jgi:outer membrane protein assembly factor BamB
MAHSTTLLHSVTHISQAIKNMRTAAAIATWTFSAMLCISVGAENWPNWRGPSSDAIVRGSGYPTSWGEDENIAWKFEVPGWGTSTPAIWEQRIFVSFDDEDKNGLLCVDRHGKLQWRIELGDAASSKNRKASSSNPSPVTDGSHVYAYFKSGDLACVTLEGEKVWQVNLQQQYGPDRLNWDLGTSPVLTDDLVVVAVMHQGPSYLVGLDKKTGQEVWKQDRDLGAPAEARDSYSTPIIIRDGDRETILVLGGDNVTAHEASTGREIWRAGGLNPQSQRNFRSIASPALADGMVIAPYARGETLTAIRLGGRGDVSETHVAWTSFDASADVPTPVALDGKVYICGDRGDIFCVDAASGKVQWKYPLPRNRYVFSASPVIAGDKLYATREDGRTFVLRVGEKPELVAENSVRENTFATPAFADGQIFLRTSDYLICIGTKP